MRSLRNGGLESVLDRFVAWGVPVHCLLHIYCKPTGSLTVAIFFFFFLVLWLRCYDVEALHLMSEITRQIRQNKMKEAREKVYIIVILQEKYICFHPASP